MVAQARVNVHETMGRKHNCKLTFMTYLQLAKITSKTHFSGYLCKEIRSNTGTGSIDRVWNIFMEKLYRNSALITSAIHSAITSARFEHSVYVVDHL